MRTPRHLKQAVAVALTLSLVGLLAYGLTKAKPDRSLDKALAKGERKPAPSHILEKLEGEGTGSIAGYRGKVVKPILNEGV